MIGLSMHVDDDMADRLREAGIAAYLPKDGRATTLIDAIRRVNDFSRTA